MRNNELVQTLRKKYALGWTHSDVQTFLTTDYAIIVSRRTLIRWKKCLTMSNWQGPHTPCPPSQRKVTADMSKHICSFRLLTGWGSYPLKTLLQYSISESTYKRLIHTAGLSRGSTIENKRVHWVKMAKRTP